MPPTLWFIWSSTKDASAIPRTNIPLKEGHFKGAAGHEGALLEFPVGLANQASIICWLFSIRAALGVIVAFLRIRLLKIFV